MHKPRFPAAASVHGFSFRSLALLGLTASLASWPQARATTMVEPGGALDALLSGKLIAASRFALDGQPPGPPGILPRAPSEPGRHWLVVYDAAGNPIAWHRLQIGNAPSESTSIITRISIDDRAPNTRLHWQQAGPLREQAQVVGPKARPRVDAEDPAHVAELQLMIQGRAVDDPDTWSEGLAEGRYVVAVRSRDRLDNSATQAQPEVWLDRSAPTVRWERIDPKQGIADDIFDGSPIRLRLIGEDAVAGVRSLRADATASEGSQLEVTAAQTEVRWQAEDRAGNAASGVIALRLDRDGPQLRIRRGNEALPPPWRLRASDSVVLEAVDPLAGVAHACIESSIWRGDCRALPITLSGIDPGRYVLRLRAADRLGNRSNSRNEIEVLP
jgi:hypothetical protein